jgi:predicted transcriptional regulator
MAVLNASVNMSAGSKMEVHPRLLMEVSPELVELLDKLAAKSQTTRTEVLRKAIALLDVSAQEKDRGRKIGIFDENGKLIQEIVGIWSEFVAEPPLNLLDRLKDPKYDGLTESTIHVESTEEAEARRLEASEQAKHKR